MNTIPSPCFVLEEQKLEKNLKLLYDIQQKTGVQIILAFKGFAMFSAFPLVRKYLAGATASSLHEARLCSDEMHTKAHVYAPAYKIQEFDELCSYSSHITFNSISQVELFSKKAQEKNISCGLRINPEYSEVKTIMYNPCIQGSRFGVRRKDLDKVPEGVEGFHFHTLCENNSYTLERTLAVIIEKFGDFLPQLQWLNMGGGHLMTQKDYDIPHLISVLKSFKAKYPNLQLIMEPGSAVAWQTGFLVSEVLDIMDSDGVMVAILDISFSAHLPDTLEMPYKPTILSALKEVNKQKPTYRLGGITCLAGDFMGDYSFENPLEIGQKIIFDDMIHYTMVKTNNFNGVQLPSIGILDTQDNFRIVKKFGYETFKERLS